MPYLSYVEEEKIKESNQAARDQDAEKKRANKDYSDKKHRADERDV